MTPIPGQTFSPELAAITLSSGLKNVGASIVWIFDEMEAGRTYWESWSTSASPKAASAS
ncbi:MAG: hypothetical protein R2881_04085 [Eubacteriales bacterium]